jgi:hypothetical protein
MKTIKARAMVNGEIVDVPITLLTDSGTGKADDIPGEEKGGVLGPGFEQRPENTTVDMDDVV